MDRLSVLENLLKYKKLNNYFEIGVFNGHIFFKMASPFKVAVDPEFKFDTLRKIGKTLINPYNLTSRYFQVTSDEFFEKHARQVFSDKKVELSLIDGMHEYEYALRDVENTLQYMSEEGVIVMHDCNPVMPQAAVPFKEWKGKGIWNGDVWKAIIHLRSMRRDINVFVLDCDHGLGIITKGKTENPLNFSASEIDKLRYEDLLNNRERFLNLKPKDYFYDYFTIPQKPQR